MSSLDNRWFREGFFRGLEKQMQGMTKSAGTGAAIPPGARGEMIALGKRLFRESTNPTDVWSGLKAVIRPGHGQLENIRSLRQNFADVLRRVSPADRVAIQRAFQRQLEQAYADVGAYAKPKMDFWEKTVPLAGGIGAGAAGGMAGGMALGSIREQQNSEERLQNMPLLDRLKYVLFPGSLNKQSPTSHGLQPTTG